MTTILLLSLYKVVYFADHDFLFLFFFRFLKTFLLTFPRFQKVNANKLATQHRATC